MQHCISDSIYRLTLAWISSETSTKQLECWLILTRSSFTGLNPISFDWSHRSGVLCRLLLSVSRRQLFELLCPTLFSRPVTTSGHGEISSPKPFVWFRAKTDKGIVCLAGHLHSVTFSVFWPFSIMLLFGWSPLGRQLPNLPGPLIIL